MPARESWQCQPHACSALTGFPLLALGRKGKGQEDTTVICMAAAMRYMTEGMTYRIVEKQTHNKVMQDEYDYMQGQSQAT